MLCPSHTLEIRSYLARAPGCQDNLLIKIVLDDLERFITRMADGPFKLRPEADAQKHLNDLSKALACVSQVDPHEVRISFQSLNELINKPAEVQVLTYSVAPASVGHVLCSGEAKRATMPFHKVQAGGSCQGTAWEAVRITLEDLVGMALLSGGLRETLRDSRYGGFFRHFEHSIIQHFCWLFSFAHEQSTARLEGTLPLTKMFRSNMPIGRYPREHGEPERWLVFCE